MDTTRMLPGEGYEMQEPEPAAAASGTNPLMAVHVLLQGRYWLATLLAIVGIAAGGYIGYKIPKPVFVCTGTVHIKPVLSDVLFDGRGTMPMYESYVSTQVAKLKAEDVLQDALMSEQWLKTGMGVTGRSNSPQAMESFSSRLEVSRNGELINVTFTDPDAATTSDAVKAVMLAYQRIADGGPDGPASQKTKWERIESEYETTVAGFDKELNDIAGPEGVEGIEMERDAISWRVNETQSELEHWRGELERFYLQHPDMAPRNSAAAATQTVAAGTTPVGTLTPGTAASQPAPALAATQPDVSRPKTPKELARIDQHMRDLLNSRDEAQLRLENLMTTVARNQPPVLAAQREVALLDKEIEKYFNDWTPETVTSTGIVPEAATLNQLKGAVALAQDNYDTAYRKQKSIAETMDKVNRAKAEQQRDRNILGSTKDKIAELKLALNESGHVELWPVPDPVFKDRRVPIAAASAFGGGLLGIGLVILLGLMDNRLRTIDQAKLSLNTMRVLGMLPSLPKNLEDPASASFAALCVHHIRMLLQVMPRLDGHPAIAITSPSPGDGKTSLTLALALSYAAAGKSTLLIDCDIVGAGLTRRINALIRRRIGQILIRENLITATELREALTSSQRSGRKLGEVLVDEGYVDADQLERALKLQSETSVGLLDVMRGEMLEECIADTGTARLWILPVGSALAEHGVSISPEGFRTVLEQARKRFEVVLIDTGPVPGSIESSVACSQADGVVMAVSRGEQGPLVKRSSEHLRDIGARALGVVFNRATPDDFSSSYGSFSSPSMPARIREKHEVGPAQFGPVAAAVAGKPKGADPEADKS